jgi:hypothetical protein
MPVYWLPVQKYVGNYYPYGTRVAQTEILGRDMTELESLARFWIGKYDGLAPGAFAVEWLEA